MVLENRGALRRLRVRKMFDGIKKYAGLHKKAMAIGLRRCLSQLKTMLTHWCAAAKVLKQERRMLEYGEKIYYHTKGRRAIKLWSDYAKWRGRAKMNDRNST